MKPITFPEQTAVLADGQPEYLSLPVHITQDKQQIISCWQLTWWERWRMLRTGRLWLRQLTFNKLPQPLLLEINSPFSKDT